ncbi:MAG: FecR family protein [Bacteroidota bacterium]|nr:FecR family protein [Bacteroidota bacterium]
MKPDRELVEKFLRNQCTDKEAEIIRQYFNQHPDEVEKHIPLNDWLKDRKKRLSITVSERILYSIRKSYLNPPKTSLMRLLVKYGVAASFIGVALFAGVKLFTKTGSRSPEKKWVINTGTDTVPVLKMIENKTAHEIQTRLQDGSVVAIYPNSSLQYLPAFEKNKREVYLKGKALFIVSKDASRPFTVYAAGIATTALGTQFIVSERDHIRNVSVQLLEGSVRVCPQYPAGGKSFVILRPGDQLIVSKGRFNNYSLLRNPGNNSVNRAPKNIAKDNPANEKNKLVFKNCRLKDVFKQMEEKFGVTIHFNPATGIEQKLFTGTFLENDSLEFVCKTICDLHSLQYSIEGTTVTISAP